MSMLPLEYEETDTIEKGQLLDGIQYYNLGYLTSQRRAEVQEWLDENNIVYEYGMVMSGYWKPMGIRFFNVKDDGLFEQRFVEG